MDSNDKKERKTKNNISSNFLVGLFLILGIIMLIAFNIGKDDNPNKTEIREYKDTDIIERQTITSSINKQKNREKTGGELTKISTEKVSTSNPTFSTYQLGDGKISIPSFLTYRGKSEDGGPMFFDSSNQIRLFLDHGANQDINMFRNWVDNELGSGTTLISKSYCFVQSGYTANNEIYYCKAFMDHSSNPSIMYTAIMLYPISRRNEVDGLLAKIFNPFPNI